MYTWSPMEVVPPPLEDVGEKPPGYLCFNDYKEGAPTFRNFAVKVYTVHWIFFTAGSILSSLSDEVYQSCEERTKRKSLKNNDDLMHPHRLMSALFGTLRCNNCPSDSNEKLPQFDLPEIRAQAISFESLVIFSTIHQNTTKKKTKQMSPQVCVEQEWIIFSCTCLMNSKKFWSHYL